MLIRFAVLRIPTKIRQFFFQYMSRIMTDNGKLFKSNDDIIIDIASDE
jgi:hypothetical protein